MRNRLRRPAAVVAALLPLLASCLPVGSPGERLYRRRCKSCHGVDGGGGVQYLADEGANLLDDAWRYGGERSSLERTMVEELVREHPDWELKPEEVQQLVDHILYLRGERR